MPSGCPFRRIGIVGQSRDPELERATRSLASIAGVHGLELFPEPELAGLVKASGDLVPGQLDLLLSFGGDGTLLRGARMVAPFHTPVLGVNLGHLGFLTSVAPDHLAEAFDALAAAAFWLDTRFTLQARVVGRDGSVGTEYLALNDAVLHKGGFARVIRLAIFIGEDREEVAAYAADGVILATPTGSTAYSLSAGGAIVAPSMECLLATPISPHTLAVRPLVLPADTRIEVEILQPDAEVVLTIDGQAGEVLANGDRLVVNRGHATVPLVRFPGQSFFPTLRRKLHWGAGAEALRSQDQDPEPRDPFAY
jgi:NAD+ kinase